MEDNMDYQINFYGRFGEHFVYIHKEDDTYVVSCEEIGMKDAVLTKQEHDELFRRYSYEGVLEFDKKDKTAIKQRAINMGRQLSREFWLFKHNNGTYEKMISAIRTYQLLLDSDVLELNETEFVDWFLCGYGKQTEEYISFMLDIKKRLIDERRMK